MTKGPHIPCGRCGITITVNLSARAGGLCNDCRGTDPVYVHATRAAYEQDSEWRRRTYAWRAAREHLGAGGRT